MLQADTSDDRYYIFSLDNLGVWSYILVSFYAKLEIEMDKINPKIGVEYVDDVVVVTLLIKKILVQSDIQMLQDSIMPLVEEGAGVKLVLDFTEVEFLSSSVLGLLIRISKKIYETGGELRLCSIDAKINEIFKITRLDKVFQILPDKDAAISDLK